MKKALLVFFTAIILVSCTKDDNNVSATAVNTTLSSGNWKVTYYWDTDHEETSSFSGYSFVFGSGNVVTASLTGGGTVTGTWAAGTDDSKVKLVLAFANPSLFIEISEDWHVIERTDTRIKLQHVSGGSGGTDYLTFEKI